MPAGNLTNANVQFQVSGVEAVKAAMDKIQQQLTAISQGVNTVGPLINSVLGMARSHLEGFVRAGVGASTVGWVWHFQMERLSRQMASLFLPAIRQVIEYTKQLADWMRRLSGNQQENIAKWVAAGAAALGVAVILPKVIAGVEALVLGIRALTVAMVGLEAGTGIGALLPLLGGLATAIAALAVGSAVATHGFGKLWGAIKPLVDNLGTLIEMAFQAIEPVVAQLAGLFDTVAQGLGEILPVVLSTVTTVGQGLLRAVQGFLAGLETILQGAMAAYGAVASIIGGMADAFSAVYEILAPVFKILGYIGAGLIQLLMAPLRIVLTIFQGLATIATPILKAIAFVLEGIVFLIDSVVSGFQWVGKLVGQVFAPITQALAPIGRAFEEIWDAVMELQTALTDTMAQMGEILAPLFGELGEAIREIVQALAGPVVDFFAGLAKLITTTIVPALKQLVAWLKEATGWLRGLTKKKVQIEETKKPHQESPRLPGGMEQVEQTWRRIAEASVKASLGGESEPEKHTGLLGEIAKNTAGTRDAVGQIKPAVV